MLNRVKAEKCSRLGKLVLDKGWINENQLAAALEYQEENDVRLGESLIELGFLSESQLKKALCKQRWMRSFVASVLMIASPVCPVLASEKDDEIDFSADFSKQVGEVEALRFTDSAPFGEYTFDEKNETIYAISHEFSPRTGIELGIASSEIVPIGKSYGPEISIYTSSKRSNPKKVTSLTKVQRFDRYKDTIPATYRLTLKGYSLYENSDNSTKYWGFDKVKDSPYKKYELMFSVTKRF